MPHDVETEVHHPRSYIIIGLIILVLAGLSLFMIKAQQVDKKGAMLNLHADATSPRPWAQAKWVSRITPDKSTHPLDPRFDPQITLLDSRSASQGQTNSPKNPALEIPLRQLNPRPDYYDGDTEILWLKDGRAPLLDGEIEIIYTGQNLFQRDMFDPPYQNEANYWPKADMQLFDIEGHPLHKQDLKDILPAVRLQYLDRSAVNWGRTYGFSYGMRYPKGHDILMSKPRLFDPDTLVSLSNSYGSRTEEDVMLMSTQVPLLSGESILTTVDLFHGPVETLRIENPIPGSELQSSHFKAQILFLMRGGPGDMGMGHPDTSGEFTIRIGADHSRRGAELTTLGITFTPANVRHRMGIEAVDHKGNVVEFNDRSSTPGIHLMVAKIKAEQIQELRFHYREGAKRIISEIPLFAMPADRQQVANLFDQVIPLTRIRSEHEWQRQIEHFTQLKNSPYGGERLPREQFPLTFENLTVRELLAAYLLERPDIEVVVDESAMTIDFKEAPLKQPLWHRIQIQLRRLNPFR